MSNGPVIQVNFPMLALAAANLKKRSADFVTHMGNADIACKPLKQSWVESGSDAAGAYQENWVLIVNGAVDLSRTIDRLSKAVAEAERIQSQQEKTLASKFNPTRGR
jgi:uncharacterized protein YukE